MLKGGLLGFVISLLCLLPPILHFVTGPLGPFIGGFVGGSQAEAGSGRAVGIGVTMGVLVALPVVPAGVLFRNGLAHVLPGPLGSTVILFVALLFPLYATALGTYGALLGGYLARRSRRGSEEVG